jgi:hypothetical protein
VKGERDRKAKPEAKAGKKTSGKPKKEANAKFLASYICVMVNHLGMEELKVGISESVLDRVAARRTWNSSQCQWYW